MSIKDIKAVPAAPPKTKDSQKVALFLGIILGVMAFCQLITLPKFIGIIYDFNFLPTYYDASAFAATLIILQILAVPFLLRLKLSNGFRATSMIMGWLAVSVWVLLSLWMWLSPGIITDQSGLLGGVLPLVSGPWTVSFVGILAVAMAWSSWGLWPLKTLKLRKTSANKHNSERKPKIDKKVTTKVKKES